MRLYGSRLDAEDHCRSRGDVRARRTRPRRRSRGAHLGAARHAKRAARHRARSTPPAGAALIEAFHRSAMGDSARALSLSLGAEIDRLRAAQDSQEGEISIGANVSDVALLTARVMLDSTRALARSAPSRRSTRCSATRDGCTRSVGPASRARRTCAGSGSTSARCSSTSTGRRATRRLATLLIGRGGQAFAAIERGHEPRAEFRLFELYSSGAPHDENVRRTAARALLSRLLGPSFPAVVAARRVYFAPPSWLAQLPLAAMLEDVRPDPAREVVLVPSATWLVHARTNPTVSRHPRASCAWGAPRTTRTVRCPDCARSRSGSSSATAPGDCCIRATGHSSRPRCRGCRAATCCTWRRTRAFPTSIRGRARCCWGAATTKRRGSPCAKSRHCPRRAPLVVLATCNASIGSNLGHESVYGIASGFLSAGSRAVVSTLWDADDRVTARFTRLFYGALEKGETAGQALRHAQLTLAADPRRARRTSGRASSWWATPRCA